MHGTTAYTHAGVFHADDVFATALIKMINPTIQIARVNRVTPEMMADDCLVFDIGEGEYDHHQVGKALREDGTPYCSFGLLWRDYGRLLCPDKAWEKVDRDLVLPIDKTDNGIERNTLSAAIHSFNPNWKMASDAADECFRDAVGMARGILANYISNANAEYEAETEVLNSTVVDCAILVLDQYLPWQDTVIEQMSDILYVVFPSNRGGYNVQTVPDAPGSFTGRKGFPSEWLGNPDKTLGMTFCHPGNFLLATETLDQAINCARIAVER